MTQAELAEAVALSRSALVAILNGRTVPRHATLQSICDAIGVSVEEIIHGSDPHGSDPHGSGTHDADTHGSDMQGTEAEPASDLYNVPLIDIAASAGHGAENVDLDPTGDGLGFPRSWLRTQFPRIQDLRVIRVRGDSMYPTLRDGSWLMIDLGQTDVSDGIAVVRYEGQLYVKRINTAWDEIRLISDNPDWPDITIDLERDAEASGLRIIGRAVWGGGAL